MFYVRFPFKYNAILGAKTALRFSQARLKSRKNRRNVVFWEAPREKSDKNAKNVRFGAESFPKSDKNGKNAKFDGCAKNAYLCTLCTNFWKPSTAPRT